MNARLITITTIALIAIMISFLPSSFADGAVTIVQDNANLNTNNPATCTFGSNVVAGNTIVIGFDASFINNPVTSIVDTRGDTFTSIGFALNSASSWVRVWQAWVISSGADQINITYTTGANPSYGMSCDEFLGEGNFTNVGGQGAGQISCNTCNLNLTATTHRVNLILGWSFSSTFANTGFHYVDSFTPKSGSDSCVAINAGTNCLLMFHGESNTPLAILGSGIGPSAIVINCSPACSQSPNFEMVFYAGNFPANVIFTSTITGFLVPNFVNGLTSFSWLYFLIIVLVPMAEIIGVITMERNSVLDRHAIIFVFLGLLLLDSIFGVMLNVVTVAMPFIFGLLFGIYLWRGRG